MVKTDDRRSATGGLREELRSVENQAVAIRKLLRQLRGRLRRGVTADAEKLAKLIESLARFGQRTTAVQAVDVASELDGLTVLLACEVDGFFAS